MTLFPVPTCPIACVSESAQDEEAREVSLWASEAVRPFSFNRLLWGPAAVFSGTPLLQGTPRAAPPPCPSGLASRGDRRLPAMVWISEQVACPRPEVGWRASHQEHYAYGHHSSRGHLSVCPPAQVCAEGKLNSQSLGVSCNSQRSGDQWFWTQVLHP